MYQVIDVRRSESVDSEFAEFGDALTRAEELAIEQAQDEGIEGESISSFENGDNPRKNPEGNWEAGAGPEGDTCGYWPHVEWAKEVVS